MMNPKYKNILAAVVRDITGCLMRGETLGDQVNIGAALSPAECHELVRNAYLYNGTLIHYDPERDYSFFERDLLLIYLAYCLDIDAGFVQGLMSR